MISPSTGRQVNRGGVFMGSSRTLKSAWCPPCSRCLAVFATEPVPWLPRDEEGSRVARNDDNARRGFLYAALMRCKEDELCHDAKPCGAVQAWVGCVWGC